MVQGIQTDPGLPEETKRKMLMLWQWLGRPRIELKESGIEICNMVKFISQPMLPSQIAALTAWYEQNAPGFNIEESMMNNERIR